MALIHPLHRETTLTNPSCSEVKHLPNRARSSKSIRYNGFSVITGSIIARLTCAAWTSSCSSCSSAAGGGGDGAAARHRRAVKGATCCCLPWRTLAAWVGLFCLADGLLPPCTRQLWTCRSTLISDRPWRDTLELPMGPSHSSAQCSMHSVASARCMGTLRTIVRDSVVRAGLTTPSTQLCALQPTAAVPRGRRVVCHSPRSMV